MAKFNKLDVPHQWKDEFTKYPHGYTIFEALCKWVKQVDNMVDNQNNWIDYLDNFVENFEFELQEEVQSTVERWQSEGLLDGIIESALNTELDNVKTQLAEMETDVLETYNRLGSLADTLNQLVVNDATLVFKPGVYYLDRYLIIESVKNVRFVFKEGAEFIDEFGVLATNTLSNQINLPYGVAFNNSSNITIDNMLLTNPFINSTKIVTDDETKRVPNFDFFNCNGVKLNNIKINGYCGGYVGHELGTIHMMRASFFRLVNCKDVVISSPNLFNNSGDGEIFSLYQCDGVVFEKAKHLYTSGKTFWSLCNLIACSNVRIKDIVDLNSRSTGNLMDISGNNIIIENVSCDYPNGDFIDLTHEWGLESGDSNNVVVTNCNYIGDGSRGILSTVYAIGTNTEKKEVNDTLTIDNLYFKNCNAISCDYFYKSTQAKKVYLRDCSLIDVARFNYEERLSDRDNLELVTLFADNVNVKMTTRNLSLEAYGKVEIINSNFKGNGKGLLLVDRYAYLNSLDLHASKSEIVFKNTVFEDIVFNIYCNVTFDNCTIKNCTFKTQNAYGINPNIKFINGTQYEVTQDSNVSGSLFDFTAGGINKLEIINSHFIGEWRNNAGYNMFNSISDFNATVKVENSKILIARYNNSGVYNPTLTLFPIPNDKFIKIDLKNSEFKNTVLRVVGSASAGLTGDVNLRVVGCQFPHEGTGISAPFATSGTYFDNVTMTVINSVFVNDITTFKTAINTNGVLTEFNNVFNDTNLL